jgi:uncharacterized membrane protein
MKRRVLSKPMTVPDDKVYEGHVVTGIAQCLGLNVVVFVVMTFSAVMLGRKNLPWWVPHSFMVAARYFGVVQLLYVVPTWLYLRKTEQKHTAKGWLIAASVTMLVSVTCMGFWPL